jgi:hypothetical protein
LVELSYRAPVNIDAENFPRLFFMMHCARSWIRRNWKLNAPAGFAAEM